MIYLKSRWESVSQSVTVMIGGIWCCLLNQHISLVQNQSKELDHVAVASACPVRLIVQTINRALNDHSWFQSMRTAFIIKKDKSAWKPEPSVVESKPVRIWGNQTETLNTTVDRVSTIISWKRKKGLVYRAGYTDPPPNKQLFVKWQTTYSAPFNKDLTKR